MSLDIPGWTSHRVRLPRGGGQLSVCRRAGENEWRDLAVEFAERGTLPGLRRVDSARTAIVQAGAVGPHGRHCYLKQFLARDATDAFKNCFRASRARRALLGGFAADAAGFGVPRPVCLIELRRLGILRLNVLVTEAIDDAPRARDWIEGKVPGQPSDLEFRRKFLRELGREIGAWHGAGLYHGDLRMGNILCRMDGDRFSFFWLDNERTRRHGQLPLQRRIHNLMQVNYEPFPITLADRARVWRAYLEKANLAPGLERDVARRVIAKTQKRWRKRGWI